jgi:hypothetical protein
MLFSRTGCVPRESFGSGTLGFLGDACGVRNVHFPGHTYRHGMSGAAGAGALEGVRAEAAAQAAARGGDHSARPAVRRRSLGATGRGGDAALSPAQWDELERALPSGWKNAGRGVPRVATCLAWSPCGSLLLAGCSDGLCPIFDVSLGAPRAPVSGAGAGAGAGAGDGSAPWPIAAILVAADCACAAAAWAPAPAVAAVVQAAAAAAGAAWAEGLNVATLSSARLVATASTDALLRIWRLGGDGTAPAGAPGALQPALLATLALPSAPSALAWAPAPVAVGERA